MVRLRRGRSLRRRRRPTRRWPGHIIRTRLRLQRKKTKLRPHDTPLISWYTKLSVLALLTRFTPTPPLKGDDTSLDGTILGVSFPKAYLLGHATNTCCIPSQQQSSKLEIFFHFAPYLHSHFPSCTNEMINTKCIGEIVLFGVSWKAVLKRRFPKWRQWNSIRTYVRTCRKKFDRRHNDQIRT